MRFEPRVRQYLEGVRASFPVERHLADKNTPKIASEHLREAGMAARMDSRVGDAALIDPYRYIMIPERPTTKEWEPGMANGELPSLKGQPKCVLRFLRRSPRGYR
jgi:hypothetical protein